MKTFKSLALGALILGGFISPVAAMHVATKALAIIPTKSLGRFASAAAATKVAMQGFKNALNANAATLVTRVKPAAQAVASVANRYATVAKEYASKASNAVVETARTANSKTRAYIADRRQSLAEIYETLGTSFNENIRTPLRIQTRILKSKASVNAEKAQKYLSAKLQSLRSTVAPVVTKASEKVSAFTSSAVQSAKDAVSTAKRTFNKVMFGTKPAHYVEAAKKEAYVIVPATPTRMGWTGRKPAELSYPKLVIDPRNTPLTPICFT